MLYYAGLIGGVMVLAGLPGIAIVLLVRSMRVPWLDVLTAAALLLVLFSAAFYGGYRLRCFAERRS